MAAPGSSGTGLLDGLAPEEAAALRALGTRLRLRPGEPLFRLGGEADRLYVVEQGKIALTLPMRLRDREEDVLVEEKSPGQALGWSALIAPHRFTLTAVAQVETEVLALPRVGLLDHFAAHPAVGYVFTRNLAALVGQRLHVFQAMWLREMQRVVAFTDA